MVSDPIGDMLIQIKNAGLAGKAKVFIPYSRLKHDVARILAEEGFLTSVKKSGEGTLSMLDLIISYVDDHPKIEQVKRMSKPGLRWYVNSRKIPKVVGGKGIAILSTPKGVVSGRKARELHVGGELLCEVW